MSVDRTGLFGWAKRDVTRLMERVRRLRRPVMARTPCEECRETDHGHRSAWVGPYLLCRCLRCPVLVVRTNE